MYLSYAGDKYHLKRLTASQCLYLKEGAPVILTSNLSRTAVNGTRGILQSALEDELCIQLKNGQRLVVNRIPFTRYDPATLKVVARRVQFPVAPAFALTLHRCQGTTHRQICS